MRSVRRIVCLLSALSISGLLVAQAPEFDAASVKPAPPGTEYGGMRGGPGTSSPRQIEYMATTLRAVTARAYGVQRFQVVGPPWFDEERFDIVAKVPLGSTAPQLLLMLQKLLADRFKLALHKENRTSVTYEMTVAKTGLKMQTSAAPQTPDAPPAGVPPSAPAYSGLMMRYSGEKVEVYGQRVTMRQLIVWATEQADRPIVDKTGLTGTYDFVMPWTPQSRGADKVEEGGPADVQVGDTLNSALEKHLGLRLVPRKEPVEMLIIDHLERVPTEN